MPRHGASCESARLALCLSPLPPYMNQAWRKRRRPPALLRGWPYPLAQLPAELKEPERRVLLFCPEQGGWHTGVRFEGRWLAHISTELVLRPTHWLPAPPDPPGFDQ